jgi:antitoxin component YwqK of YwqJK toxin-antitoxin module
MKKLLVILIAILPLLVHAQTTEIFYDQNWKPCTQEKARYRTLLEKTDSGWWRRDFSTYNGQVLKRGLYRDSTCNVINGTLQQYYANGIPSSVERRVKGKIEGHLLRYYPDGMLMDSGYYQNHKQVGVRMLWHRNGYPSDSITRTNDSTLVVVNWFDDGSPAAAGYRVHDRRQGKWQYFHPTGKQAGVVIYDKDKAISKTYYNEDGGAQPDTAAANREAVFKKKGMEGWRNYLRNNTAWPAGFRLANVTQVTINMLFCVNEEGKITNAEVLMPFHPVFDKEALKIILQSPDWLPAIEHNRTVKAWRRQPLTFEQQQ